MFEEGKPFTARRLAKWLAGTILAAAVGTIATGTLAPWLDWFSERGSVVLDAATCGGRTAMTEGDRLSELAAKEPSRAIAYFTEANPHYIKAYGCGFPDAGIRLAVAHCMGLGVPKEPLKARQYILEVEAKHPSKLGRAKDVRKLCGFAS